MAEGERGVAGKSVMITGASNGIGKAAAIALASMGARLTLVCRDRRRGDAAAAEIRQRAGRGSVDLLVADLSSQKQIRALARDFLATGQPLHVLINNAGVVNLRRSLTGDGIETVFAVNHLAYYMLTLLLLDRLKASAPARIVNVASAAHRAGSMNFDDLGGERRYGAFRIYGQSKLANILFTYEMARRLREANADRVTVNCLHPGGVKTGLGRNNGVFAKIGHVILDPFMKTAEDGARTTIHCASAPELDGVSGEYFVDCKPARSSKESYDESIARRLWEVSAGLTGVDLE